MSKGEVRITNERMRESNWAVLRATTNEGKIVLESTVRCDQVPFELRAMHTVLRRKGYEVVS